MGNEADNWRRKDFLLLLRHHCACEGYAMHTYVSFFFNFLSVAMPKELPTPTIVSCIIGQKTLESRSALWFR
jgi:hypothetical protein